MILSFYVQAVILKHTFIREFAKVWNMSNNFKRMIKMEIKHFVMYLSIY